MRLREKKTGDRTVIRCEETEWLGANRRWLEREHPGNWVAVEVSEPVAVGPDLEQVLAEARAKGITEPLVAGIWHFRMPRVS